MAKSTFDQASATVMKVGVVVAAGYIFYRLAYNHSLGDDLYQVAHDFADLWSKGSKIAVTPGSGGSTTTGGGGTGTSGIAWRTSDGQSGTGVPSCFSIGSTVRKYPQDNGNGTYSAVAELANGNFWYITFSGSSARAAMENWYTNCWGAYTG